mgnify:CR=1 FL=1
MTISSVTQMWSRNSGSSQISDDRKTRSVAFRAGYQVVHTADTTTAEVLAASGLPKPGDVLAGTSLFVKRITPNQVSPILTLVDVEWGGEIGPSGSTSDSPVNKAPEFVWSDVETDEPTDEDIDGNPIVTANNEPIDGVTMKIADQVLSVKRNFATLDLFAISQYRHSVNSDSFLGWPAGTARLTSFSARNVIDTSTGYWEVSAKIQFRRGIRTTDDKAWYKRVRHEGFYVKNGDGQIVRAVDANKQPTQRPVLLKSDGTQETVAANAVWLEFPVYTELPYNTLGLV